MTKKELANKIEELEKKVAALEPITVELDLEKGTTTCS